MSERVGDDPRRENGLIVLKTSENGMTYYEACVKMEQMKVDAEYLLGWQIGYWLHPQREEQRVNDAYSAGYDDGKARNTSDFAKWAKAA